jgi:hypothetical protein
MTQQLLSSFGKTGVNRGLDTLKVDIEDTAYLSKYFVLAEYTPVFTAGKNLIMFNGSSLLKTGSAILVECIDSQGNSQYIEQPQSITQYTDVAKFSISVNIFNETYNGPGKLIFVGSSSKGEIVRWQGNITIDKTLPNSSKVRFYNFPELGVRPLLYPVVDMTVGSQLGSQIGLIRGFYTYAVNPPKDTNQSTIDARVIDVDYRLVLVDNNPADIPFYYPQLSPTNSFNSQMEGQEITLNIQSTKTPFSYQLSNTALTQSFIVKKVLDSKTLQLDEPFFYPVGKDQIVTEIATGSFSASYHWVAYNTSSQIYQILPSTSPPYQIFQSYAEITYRNLDTFSGFVARHKLYKKSLMYPGDFQLVVDQPLASQEMLTDPITVNKTYADLGKFYNQYHINQYWSTSSNSFNLIASISPINSMIISSNNYSVIDGTKYIMASQNTTGTASAAYIPYDQNDYNDLSGKSYDVNFINLTVGSLYVLSVDVILNKAVSNLNANISFYFTSSISSINQEPTFTSRYGMLLGTVSASSQGSTAYLGKQTLFFTPLNDYFGTLVIVPYQCNATISEVSLQIYGDYGYSPDVLITKIPVPINIPNEIFQFKSELYDINHNLVYSDLSTLQAFDPSGVTMNQLINKGNPDPSFVSLVKGNLTISQSLYLPNIPLCPTNIHLLGWHTPTHHPPRSNEGQVCYTDVTDLSNIGNNEYISLSTLFGIITTIGRSIDVKYTGSSAPGGAKGRHIWVDLSGNKTESP